MGMVVRTNMAGLNANNALNMASKTQQNAMQKLASGFRINKAADDASGLAISEKMKNQIKALDTAADNCEDGANMIQTAEGYMAETHDMLNRMVELSEKAANGVLDQTDRDALQDEMDELCAEIDRMATTANFNGKKLMDGSIGSSGVVSLTSNPGESIKYTGPSAEVNNFGSGTVLSDPNLAEGAKYTYNSEGTNTATDFSYVEVKVSMDRTDGTTDNTTANLKTIKVAARIGDTVTLDANGDGKSNNGLVFDGVTGSKGGTFTFTRTYDANGNINGAKWLNADGDEMDTTTAGTLSSGMTGSDKFTYDSKNAVAAAKDLSDPNNAIKLQIGESSTSADKLNVSINSFHTDTLFGDVEGFINRSNNTTDDASTAAAATKVNNTISTYTDGISIDIGDQDKASAAADALRQISNYVSDERGKLGAQQNRLEHTVNNLTTTSENITASNSRIRDTNMAEEMMSYTSKNVVAQAAQAMLAQANSQPQNVLSLLQ